MLEKPEQLLALFPGDGIHLAVGVDTGGCHHLGDHLLGKQIIQCVAEIVVAVFFKVRQQSAIHLHLIETGLEIDLQMIALLVKAAHMGRSGQGQRAADAEVGEHQLSQLPKDLFVVFKGGERHIAKAESLHGGAGIPLLPQRHQGALQRRDGVSHRGGHTVAFAGGAGGGIGYAAGGQDHGLCRIDLLLALGAGHNFSVRAEPDSPVPDQAHMQGLQTPLQCGADIEGAVTDGKDPVAPLCFQRDAQSLKKCHGIPPIKVRESTVKEFSITRRVLQQLFHGGVVGHIAAALPRDIQFFAQPLVRLQQRDCRPVFRGENSGHHTGSAAADDQYTFFTHHPSFRTPRRRSKYPPVPQRCGKHRFPCARPLRSAAR